jgi:hypothetical protein
VLRLAQGTKSEEYSAPKTVLGFCAVVLGIVATACVAATGVLASRDSTDGYALLPLAFFALFTVAMFVAVWWVLVKDPIKLQLGHVTGREYIDYQKLTLGDSIAGDEVRTLPVIAGEPAVNDQKSHAPGLPERSGKADGGE